MVNNADSRETIDSDDGTAGPLLLLALVAILLSSLLGWWASSTGLCNDELLYLRAIELGPVDSLMAEGSSHPPLGRLAVWPFVDSSSPDWMLRLPSILCAITTLLLWHMIFQQLFRDRYLAVLILVLAAGNIHWLKIGFLVLPYAMLTMLATAHALFWLRLVRSQSRLNIIGFVLTGAATIWVHFYGANLLVADQLIWFCIVLRERKFFRIWLTTSLLSLLLALPVVPIALFYVQVEKPYALVEITDFAQYFRKYSLQIFSSVTYNVRQLGLTILIWYGIAAVAVFQFFFRGKSPSQNDANADHRRFQFLIVAGVFLAGMPAAQAHSLLFEKAMWPRYTLVASWTHWPLLFLFLQQLPISRFVPRAIAFAGVAITMYSLVIQNQLQSNIAFDYNNEIQTLKEQSLHGDGILVQDFDFFVGPANCDHLWYQRYSPVELEPFSGEPSTRFEVRRNGIDFDSIPPSIDRFWIYSGMYNEESLRAHVSPNWKLVFVEYGDCPWYPLARFERVEQTPKPPSLDQ